MSEPYGHPPDMPWPPPQPIQSTAIDRLRELLRRESGIVAVITPHEVSLLPHTGHERERFALHATEQFVQEEFDWLVTYSVHLALLLCWRVTVVNSIAKQRRQ